MLQYLVILLDDTSVSYCHYENPKTERRPISLDDLNAGILFAMKENLTVQFVYPSHEIPAGYREAIETIDHVKIMPSDAGDISAADVVVFKSMKEFTAGTPEADSDKIFILRTRKRDLFKSNPDDLVSHSSRLNIVITDVETFTEADFDAYRRWLSALGAAVAEVYRNGRQPRINLLTDRLSLDGMNNCNAGFGNITLAPNGKFYVCPAFYIDNETDSLGTPQKGAEIKNPQLYKLEYAPLCRRCDAYHCKRCVWLNRKTTLEINTPSHEQCVVAHLERNAAESLLNELKPAGFFRNEEIPAIDYLDPFEVI